MQKNQIYYGDNLTVLREHIKDESVDLIYPNPISAARATVEERRFSAASGWAVSGHDFSRAAKPALKIVGFSH